MIVEDFLRLFKGIFVPLVTPLNDKGEIDADIEGSSLEALVNHVIDGGANGIIANGATAEFYALNREKREQNLAWVVHYIGGRVPVIANVTDNIREGSFEKVLDRTKANIDNVPIPVTDLDSKRVVRTDAVLLCPYYYKAIINRNVVEFTEKITDYAKEKGLPLILYNHSGLHPKKGNLPVSLVKQLSNHENIVGIKDSSGDLKHFIRLLAFQNDYFKVFQGSEKLLYESFRHIKPAGIVPSLANAATKFVKNFYYALSKFNDEIKITGDESVRSFYEQPIERNQRRMDKLCQLIYGKEYQAVVRGIKTWLREKGIVNTDRMVGLCYKRISNSNIRKAERLIALGK